VSPHQRKTIVVLFDLLSLDGPSANRVALLAIGAQFAAMNVGVAFGAQVADVGEDWFGVALRAGNVLVQTTQREARRVVIKFRNSSDRLPSVERVAILAGNVQRAMRAAGRERRLRLRSGRGLLSGCRQSRQHHNRQNYPEPDSRAQGSLPSQICLFLETKNSSSTEHLQSTGRRSQAVTQHKQFTFQQYVAIGLRRESYRSACAYGHVSCRPKTRDHVSCTSE
jgi:hypothetical protein